MLETAEAIGFVRGAFATQERWRDGLRAALAAVLRWVQKDPARARFLLTEALADGKLANLGRPTASSLVDLVDAGRQELPDPSAVSREMAEAVTGALLHRILAATHETSRPPEALTAELMYVAVLPYLGHEAAREELRRYETGPNEKLLASEK
jgi:hypothetical protein